MPHVTPLHADDPRRVGRYRLTGRIAGMPVPGPVYLARTVDGSDVTITLVRGDWTGDHAERELLVGQIRPRKLQRLGHVIRVDVDGSR